MSSIEEKVEQLVERVEDIIEQLEDLKLELKERWVEIEADPEYEISSLGRVRKRRNGFEPKISVHKGTGYYQVKLNGKQYYLHRLLAEAFIPNPEGKPEVDHIDGDRQNNCLSNLRWCTRAENQRNVGKRITNTSGYKGVSFHKRDGKWQVRIRVDGKQKHLGYFHTPEEAAAVYREAAKREFGEFYREL